ncbi:neuroglian [Patella vulgata]|uniref:neuroglian n=1 Tax=Patella vulgata TaxID=6465 RepID=UPI0024A9B176|nr:neuroglian [Patella vulgata]XP_050412765.2 neuroglian [Patella vulgata]
METLHLKSKRIWMFLFVIYLPGLSAITRPPSINIQPNYDVYYKGGETVEMPCVADGEPQPNYTWTRNSEEFNTSGNDDRVVQLPNVGTIVINRPEDKDEGVYQCFADNGYGKSATININLRIAKLDQFAIAAPIIHTPNLGDPLTLDCVLPDSVPSPQFYWAIRNESHQIAIDYDARITLDDEARLRITNVKAEDRQEDRAYTCIALNRVARQVVSGFPNFIKPRGTVETLHNVNYMWASPSDHYGLRGDEFKLKCIFSGNPTPVVHWTKMTGGTMPPGVNITSFGPELIFPHLEFSDAGEYECVGNNTITQTPGRVSFSLRVESRPYWVDGGLKDAEVAIGESANFSCKAGGVPVPYVQWFVNGVRLSGVTDPRITNGRFKVLTDDTAMMINVTLADAMVIQCNVSNKHGYIWGDSYLIAYLPMYTIESVGQDYINVTWSLDDLDKTGTVMFVEYRKLGDSEWMNSTVDYKNTRTTIPDLEPGATYELRVVAIYRTQRVESNITQVATTADDEVPMYTIESVGQDYINVTWSLDDLDKTGTVMFVEYRKLGDSEWMNSTVDYKNTRTTIPDLEPGATYELRVVAIYRTQRVESNITQVATTADDEVNNSRPLSNIEWILGFLGAVVAVHQRHIW